MNHILRGRISAAGVRSALKVPLQPHFSVIAVLVLSLDPGLIVRPSVSRKRLARDRGCGGNSTAGNSQASTRTPGTGAWSRNSLRWISLKAHPGVVAYRPSSFAYQLLPDLG